MSSRHIEPESFGFLVTDLSRLLRAELDRRIGEAGLEVTAGEARTLAHLARAGSVRQSVLAELMGIEAMTVSGFLDRLEQRGLVTRGPDPGDRRAKLVHLTVSADGVLERIGIIIAGLRTDMIRDVDPVRFELVRQTLATVHRTLLSMRPECGRGSSAA